MHLVPVTLRMDADCILRVSVGEPQETGGVKRDGGTVDDTTFYILALYLFLLVVLYVGLKVFFSDVRGGWEIVPEVLGVVPPPPLGEPSEF